MLERGAYGSVGARVATSSPTRPVVGLRLNRLLARFDLGGVACDRPDDAPPEGTLDQRGMEGNK